MFNELLNREPKLKSGMQQPEISARETVRTATDDTLKNNVFFRIIASEIKSLIYRPK